MFDFLDIHLLPIQTNIKIRINLLYLKTRLILMMSTPDYLKLFWCSSNCCVVVIIVLI